MPAVEGNSQPWRQVAPGVREKVLVEASEARLLLYEIAPDRHFPAHAHREANFGLILQGGGRHHFEGTDHRVEAGDSYYVPPNILHDFRSNPGIKTMVVEVVVSPGRDDASAAVAQRLLGQTTEVRRTTVAPKKRPSARRRTGAH